MDGADELIFGKIADLYPHVRIVNTLGPDQPVDEDLLAELRADPRTLHAEPVFNKKTLIRRSGGLESGEDLVLIQLIGTDRVGKDSLYILHDDLKDVTVPIGPGQILLGWPLGARLGAFQGDKVRVSASNPVKTALGLRTKHMDLVVANWFNAGFYDFDANTAFVSRATIEDLYRLHGGADYIHVMLKDPFAADAFKHNLDLPPYYRVTTWSEENGEFFAALKLEKLALFVILLLIILVAAFNIIGTLILMVIEKTREIGILKAIGASPRLISRIFLLDGMLIGLVGTGAGLAAGLFICSMIPLIKFDMPAAVYNFNSLPVQVRPLTVAIIVASAMAICTLAALFPARQAARLDPVQALRYD
jgi:lipoprotein-releasing system permease protein